MKYRLLIGFLAICCAFIFSPQPSFAQTFAGKATVSGKVTDSATNKPLKGLRVRLKHGTMRRKAFTNAEGKYKFYSVPVYQDGNRLFNLATITVFSPDHITQHKQARLELDKENKVNFELKRDSD